MNSWNDLLIKAANDGVFRNGYDHYHVRMGSGFIDAIEKGTPLKEPIENESRREHGTRMLVNTKRAKREVLLTFYIFGSDKGQYMLNKKKFETAIYGGMVDIIINDENHYSTDDGKYSDGVYHLVYTGKSVSYKHSYNGKFGIWTAQFIEPNPSNRSEDANEHVRVIPEPRT